MVRRAQWARFVLLLPALAWSSGCDLIGEDPWGDPWTDSDTGSASWDPSGSSTSSAPSSTGSTSSGTKSSSSSSTASDTGKPGNTPGFSVTIRADSNRDGKVDLTGMSDQRDKLVVSATKGAMFLPNIDDDSRRCKDGASEKSESCFDAADEIVNGPEDAKDLAPIRTLPLQVSDAAKGTVRISAGQADRVRLFVQTSPGQYKAVKDGDSFDAKQLRAGLSLALEGKDIVRNAKKWDGSIRLKFEVVDGSRRASDEVALRVAPILTHTHAEHVDRLVAAPLKESLFDAFRRDLEKGLANAGNKAPLYLEAGNEDEWAQDWFEPFFASVPGPNGPQTMRVLLRSDQQARKTPQLDLYKIAGPNVAVTKVRLTKASAEEEAEAFGPESTYNSFGNLETIPPHPGYPAGRQIMGGFPDNSDGPSHVTTALLKAQGMQNMLLLDTSWLGVGHVDEYVSFVPAKDAKFGFKIMVADPVGAFKVMEKAVADGHGKTKMISYTPTTAIEKEVFKNSNKSLQNPTIESFIKDKKMLMSRDLAEKKVNAALEILKKHTGVPDKDILRVPVLFHEGPVGEAASVKMAGVTPMRSLEYSDFKAQKEEALREIVDAHPLQVRGLRQYLAAFSPPMQLSILEGMRKKQELRSADSAEKNKDRVLLGAFLPNAVNSVVLSKNKHMLVAKQFGPVVNGKDILEAAVTKALQSVGYTPQYVDDYLTYHSGGGEVHCGSNTLRVPSSQWWIEKK